MSTRAPQFPGPTNPLTLPLRLTTCEVLALARCSKATLRRRQRRGQYPKAVEHGVYLRDQVLQALGLVPQFGNYDDGKFKEAADAFHRDRASGKRGATSAR